MASLSDIASGYVAVSSSKEEGPKTVFGQIWDYLIQFLVYFMSILGFIITCATLIALAASPFAAIAIGAKYLRSCPAMPKIPIYLIVLGCMVIPYVLLIIVQSSVSKAEESKIIKVLEIVFPLFSFVWVILGMRWVASIENKFSSDPEANNFCDSFLYSFAYWLPYAYLIMFGILCVCVCLEEYLKKKN